MRSARLSLWLALLATAARGTQLYIDVPRLLDPGASFDTAVTLYEVVDKHDVVLTLDLPEGVDVISSVAAPCALLGSQISCKLANPAATTTFKFSMKAPKRYEGGTLTFHAGGAGLESTATSMLYRTLFVTSTADGGSGSLRAAVEEANALCTETPPCTIRFNIVESSATPWKTVRLKSSLPPLRASRIRIDGATQRSFTSLAPRDTPPIEISGGGVAEDDGFTVNCYAEIASLAINGFRRNGISLIAAPGVGCACSGCTDFETSSSIHDNYIGTDPTGTIALPNGRGIGVVLPFSPARIARISDNVISGNARSGIFVIAGDLEIRGNRIGVQAGDDGPLPNGASGMYFDLRSSRTDVIANTVAFNREMGIAIHPQAPTIYLQSNSIWGNGAQAVDYGLDGTVSGGQLTAPIIGSAVFDPSTGKTTVRGTAGFQVIVQLFASDTAGSAGSGDARHPLGEAVPSLIPLGAFQFVAGDLRGKWVTAMSTQNVSHPAEDIFRLNRSSELSAAVEVH